MNSNAFCATALIIFIRLTQGIASSSCVGCVDLDEITFDKIVPKFKYTLLKFDTAFPYGDKHEAYGEFAKKVSNDELLVAHIGVKNYGENENEQLAKRFKVKEKDFPAIFFFKDGNVENYVKFPSKLTITIDNLKTFIMENSELYLGLNGCLKEFNELVKDFPIKSKDDMENLIEKATNMINALSVDADKTNAKYYLTFMKKILEKDSSFVKDESARLKKLQTEKLSDTKKVEIQKKLNVLQAFQIKKKEENKSEL